MQLHDSDLANLRLVNKQWSTVAAMVLWAHVGIDLIETTTRKLETLVDPHPNGFLSNVRRMTVTTSRKDLSSKNQKYALKNLRRLLGVLPRDCLTSFHSKFHLDHECIGILLRNQSHISKMKITLHMRERLGLPGRNYTRGNLDRLRELVVCVHGNQHHIYQGYHV